VVERDGKTRKQPQVTVGLVTIVIPCYNQAQFLGEAIESALAQSYQAREVIVVDDGSTDATAEVALSYADVRLLQQANFGQAVARNRGLSEAQGEFVVFLDADDRLRPEALATGLRCLAAHPEAAFAYGHIKLIAGDGRPLPTPNQVGVERDYYQELLRNNYIWTPGAVIYRRSVFGSVGGFRPRVNGSEDFELNVRIAREFPICCSGEWVLEYRLHGKNTTCNYAAMLKSSVSARRAHRPYIVNNKTYMRAWREGVREVQRGYGDKLVNQVQAHWRAGDWAEAGREWITLLRYHPRGAVKACLPGSVMSCLQRLRARLAVILVWRRVNLDERGRH
jgi:glycosyltransferase involved in cell wall biosynthesis